MGKISDQQIATEPERQSSVMQLAPGNPYYKSKAMAA
jgi:hypothetical protein